ncbi:hypothetical protein [Paenibacillus pabuli]|uniref:hypothetical protein n=1 Tax=Paenibacillus pabuli TaxID=1472 RepID=UPI0011B94A58|nr:hypothetical protein [Paenibacillus pabuli]
MKKWIWIVMFISVFLSLVGLYVTNLQIIKSGLYIIIPAAVVYIVLFALMPASVIIIGSKNTEFKYSSGGELSDWYEPTYLYNKNIDWLETVLKNLQTKGLSLQSNVILSPSANKGKYEYEISKKFPNSTVIATDIFVPNGHVTSENNFTYLSGNNNAIDARHYLKSNNIVKVDLIFDIKGALWHSGNDKNLKRILEEYYSILNKGGTIVFDAYDYSYKYNFRMNPKSEGYRENSTLSKIEKMLNKSEWINKHFDIIPAGKGETKVAILRKK